MRPCHSAIGYVHSLVVISSLPEVLSIGGVPLGFSRERVRYCHSYASDRERYLSSVDQPLLPSSLTQCVYRTTEAIPVLPSASPHHWGRVIDKCPCRGPALTWLRDPLEGGCEPRVRLHPTLDSKFPYRPDHTRSTDVIYPADHRLWTDLRSALPQRC